MVSVQAACNLATAIRLMEDRAVETEATLDEIASLVIKREIRFGD
jgi:hypothetical protein